MSILIIDDSEEIGTLIRLFLKSAGYEDVVYANSAGSAKTILGLEAENDRDSDLEIPKIDLILLDIIMPDMNGIDLCRLIKSSDAHKDIPVVMTTAVDKTSLLEEAFEAGAIDYLNKPLNKIELAARARSLLKLKAETDKRKERELELLELNKILQSVNEQLKRLSSLDGLTGISNRRSFDERLNEEWNRERRNVAPLSLILIDIDFFKLYNDNYGHLAGDECLARVANCLKETVHRPGDFVARYGGEEFVVILPETDEKGAMVIAENLRLAVEKMNLEHKMSKVSNHVTISLGVATILPSKLITQETLIDSADKALYTSKEKGRNRASIVID